MLTNRKSEAAAAEKNEKKNQKKGKKAKWILPVIIFSIVFTVAAFTIGFVQTVYSFTRQKESDSFQTETKNTAYQVNDKIKEIISTSQNIAADIQTLIHENGDQEEILRSLQVFCKATRFSNIKYFDGDSVYNMSGRKALSVPDEIVSIRALEQQNLQRVCYAYDQDLGADALEVYIPMKGSRTISGIITCVSIQDFGRMIQLSSNLDYLGYLVDASGKILLSNASEAADSSTILGTLFESFREDDVIALMNSVKNGTEDMQQKVSADDGVLVTYQPLADNLNWGIVNIKSTAETASNFQSVQIQIYMIGGLLGALMIGIVVYVWFSRQRFNRELEKIENTDLSLGCYNLPAFQAALAAAVKSKHKSQYAILYMGVLNYEYIVQMFGTHISNDCLRYFYRSIRKIVEPGELVGRASADHFILMLRYTDDDTLIRRYEMLYQYMYNYLPLKEKGFNIHIYAGIYPIDESKHYTAAEMIECAKITFKSLSMSTTDSYMFYDSILRDRFMNKAEIESVMKQSLHNDEFLLYFQPKYNIKRRSLDSAEVLVRWRHPTRGLVSPLDFIPLFESNGFIVELDKYIYLKSLKTIQERMRAEKKMPPLSINVSRISAIEPGFLKFYIENKNRYEIPDNMIELEFTESFALESYNTIEDIVNTLKRNGIRCSIDDFGSGYSSFSVLKQLQMDVLKMDKLFLNKGSDFYRDKILISGVIDLGKQFGMKIVQEGVETEEEYRMLRDLGCDAIQGYWYSKALGREEFESFLDEKGMMTIEEMHGEDLIGQPAFMG